MKIAFILSGCGHQDGTEIHEAVLAMLGLEQEGAKLEFFAPDKMQAKVQNHITQKPLIAEARNVLIESARIARGKVRALTELDSKDFEGIVIPGGFGAALNLCNFAEAGDAMSIDPDLEKCLFDFHKKGAVMGAICIAPVILARMFGEHGARVTVGHDEKIAGIFKGWGAEHVKCRAEDAVVDEKNRLVTTPAYMVGTSPKEISTGIFSLCKKVVHFGK